MGNRGKEGAMGKVIIGGGQGFWGDSNGAAIHMVRHSDIN